MISFRGFHGDNDSRVSSISSPIVLSVFLLSSFSRNPSSCYGLCIFLIYMVVHITEILTDQFYHPLATILICTQNPSSDSFVFSPSINLKKKKILEQHQKTKKKREEKRDRKGEKEKQNQRNKKGILSDPELFFSRLESHCLLSLQLTIVGSNTSVEAPMRYLCVRFWHVLHSMHLTCLRARKFAPCTHLSHF